MRDLLRTVGLGQVYPDGHPNQFSSGQRQRIGIARALAVDPEFVVLDEPVSALDVSVQSQVLNLLADLRERFGRTYLFISHDLSVVRHLCTRVAVMYLGKIVELADTRLLYATPRHPYTAGLLAALPVADPKQRHRLRQVLQGEVPSPISPPPGCRFHTRCPMATAVCSQEEPKLAGDAAHQVACHNA